MTRFICTSVTPEVNNDVQAFPAAYPLEVEYKILYHLRDQCRLLIACNAVCRAWRAEIRPYLFHTVHFRRSYGIRESPQDEDSILFLELIQQSPDIPQYVRRLVLAGSTRYWAEILSQLQLLEDLTITSPITGAQPVLQSLQEDMVKYRETLPPIKHLRLYNLQLNCIMTSTLPQFLLGFPKVSTLILHYVHSGMNGDTPPAHEILPELENLTMEYPDDRTVEWMLHDRSDTRLRNISLIWLNAEDLFLYQDMLDRSGMMTPEHSAVFITTLGAVGRDEVLERETSSLLAFLDSAQLMQATFSLLNGLDRKITEGIEMEVWTEDIDTLRSLFDWEELARIIAHFFYYLREGLCDFTFTLIHKLSSGQRDLPPRLLEEPLQWYFSMEPGVERLQFRVRASDT